MKKIFVLFLAVLLVSVTACKNPFFKNMLEGGNSHPGFHTPNTPSEEPPFVEGGAVLTLSPDKLDIKVKVVTSDGNPVTVEGCTETSLASGNSTYTELHAQGTVVILKGKITELSCSFNQLTALNVQGLSALRELDCRGNQLTALNVQGCTALQKLYCSSNLLTALNVQGCTALQSLNCWNNRLTAEAFTQIFKDLPQRDAGVNALCILYTEKPGFTECNHTDFTTPSAVQAAFQNAKDVKNWKMYKYNTSWNLEEI